MPSKKRNKTLANPLQNNGSTSIEPSVSVFYNPFKKDQEAKNSLLERHVKLSTNPKDVLEINGKKICWNYRKGRCKFGHKCKYIHDSDIIRDNFVPNNNTQSQSCINVYEHEVIQCNIEQPKKRKPGLSEGLVPNKRSRKMHKENQLKDNFCINKG